MLATGGEQGEEEDLVTYGGQDACQVRDLGNKYRVGELVVGGISRVPTSKLYIGFFRVTQGAHCGGGWAGRRAARGHLSSGSSAGIV